MRVTLKTSTGTYLKNLQDIQERQYNDNMRQASGKELLSIGDDPKAFYNTKTFETLINRNKQYNSNIDEAVSELQEASTKIDSIQDILTQIRSTSIDSTQTGTTGNTYSLAVYVRGLLSDLVSAANSDNNGKYIFSGTITSADAVASNASANSITNTNNMPYEIVEGTATADNPSGLSVVFKGNTQDREIDKDSKTTEVISVNSEELFGDNSTAIFKPVIDMYNLLAYNNSGQKRGSTDFYTKDDIAKLDSYQQKIATFSNSAAQASAKVGSVLDRLDAVKSQTTEENTRLDNIKSNYEDADYAETAINLAKENTALQYTLQAGSKLISKTLFDFLS